MATSTSSRYETGIRRPSREPQGTDTDTNTNISTTPGADRDDTPTSPAERVPPSFTDEHLSNNNGYVDSILSGDLSELTNGFFTGISQIDYEHWCQSQDWFASLPDYYKQQVLHNPYIATLNGVKNGIFEAITHKALEKRRQAITQINEYIATILEKQGQRESTKPSQQLSDYYEAGINAQFQQIGPSNVSAEAKTDGSASIDTSPVVEPSDVLQCIMSSISTLSSIWVDATAGVKSIMEAKNFLVDNKIKQATSWGTTLNTLKEAFETFYSSPGDNPFTPEQFNGLISNILGKDFSNLYDDFGILFGSSERGSATTLNLSYDTEDALTRGIDTNTKRSVATRNWKKESKRIGAWGNEDADTDDSYFSYVAKLYDLYEQYNAEAANLQAEYEKDYYEVIDGSLQGSAENASYLKSGQTNDAIGALRETLNGYVQTIKRKALEGDIGANIILASAAFGSLFVELQGLPHYGSRSGTRRSVNSNGEFTEVQTRETNFGF